MAEVKADLFDFMAGKYKFDPSDMEALSIWDYSETFEMFASFFLAFKIFLVAIGCMTLITGGVGVTNIMNVVIEERTKEIGIKMAVGAKKFTILFQFLFETITLTAVGGFLGFMIGAFIIWIFPESLEDYIGIPTLNTAGALFSIAILGLVAFIAGIFPARRAANLEPVKALKLF
jgi:putative ABC transport system permease protein